LKQGHQWKSELTPDFELTPDHLVVLYDLYLARLAGNAGSIKPEYLPEVHDLCEQRWLERHWFKGDTVFWFTDAALAALGITS
jgi:hypothetical protein